MPVPYGEGGRVASNSTGQYVRARPTRVATPDYNLVHLLQQAGFRGQGLENMFRIVMAESGGRANAYNPNAATGDRSYGLAQINMLGQMGVNRAREYGLRNYNQLFDPLTNLRIAYRMSNRGTNFNPWTTYTSGRYLQNAFNPGFVVTHVGAGAPGARGTFQPYTYAAPGATGYPGVGPTGLINTVPTPSLSQYLGADTVFQDQLAAMHRQLSDYLASNVQKTAQEGVNYASALHNLAQQNAVNQQKLLDTYGGRGLAHSSIYGDAYANLGKQFATAQNQLTTQHAQYLAQLAQDQRAFQDQQQVATQQAMADAAARRAATYGAAAGVKMPTASAIGAVNPNK